MKQKRKKPYLYRLMRKIKRTYKKWAWQYPDKAKKLYMLCIVIISIIIAGIVIHRACINRNNSKPSKPQATMTATPAAIQTAKPVATDAPSATVNPTKSIYTYLQGPKSWSEKRDWSGAWGQAYYNGGSFGGFGCGLCCMANVYSSITPYQCTPVDMYAYAKKSTYYWGGGAIDWGYMKTTLTKAGVECSVRRKPRSYVAFRKQIANSVCSIVLVSSYDSTCYWKSTPGHYVTIFLYDEKTDKVFLADSGDPTHNRHWVSLGKIYKSLKKSSKWQYLKVDGYNIAKDKYKHKTVNGKWIIPAYISGDRVTSKSVKEYIEDSTDSTIKASK